MLIQQTIVIIGTGCTAKLLACILSTGEFNVLLCDEAFLKAEALAGELQQQSPGCRVEAMQCLLDGAWEADIIILALPVEKQLQLVTNIREVVNQKIIIRLVEEEAMIVKDNAGNDVQQHAMQQLLPNTIILPLIMNPGIHVSLAANPAGEKGFNSTHATQTLQALSALLQTGGLNFVLPV